MHKSEANFQSNPKCYEEKEFLEENIEKDKINEDFKEEKSD